MPFFVFHSLVLNFIRLFCRAVPYGIYFNDVTVIKVQERGSPAVHPEH